MKKIKMMLALLAALVCGGAWAEQILSWQNTTSGCTSETTVFRGITLSELKTKTIGAIMGGTTSAWMSGNSYMAYGIPAASDSEGEYRVQFQVKDGSTLKWAVVKFTQATDGGEIVIKAIQPSNTANSAPYNTGYGSDGVESVTGYGIWQDKDVVKGAANSSAGNLITPSNYPITKLFVAPTLTATVNTTCAWSDISWDNGDSWPNDGCANAVLTIAENATVTTASGTSIAAYGVTVRGGGTLILSNERDVVDLVAENGLVKVPTSFRNKITLKSQGKYDIACSGNNVDYQYMTIELAGGTLANEGTSATGNTKIQFQNIQVTDDSTISSTKQFYGIASGYNKFNFYLNGHKITKDGSAEYKLIHPNFIGGGDIEVKTGTFTIQDFGAEANTTLNIKLDASASMWITNNKTDDVISGDVNYVNNGTLNVDADTTIHNYSGSGTFARSATVTLTGIADFTDSNSLPPNLKVMSTTGYKFPVSENSITLTSGTLTLDSGITGTTVNNVICYVGDNAILANLTYDTTNKTVSYEKVRDPGDIYYYSGYFNAGSAGNKPTLKTGNAIETAYIPGDTVVVSDKAEVYFAPICFSSVKIASDVTFKSGEGTESLDGATFAIFDNATLTLAEGASGRGLNLGDVTFNVTDGGKVVFSTSASANKISGNAPIELADGVNLTVSAELTDGRVVCAAKIAGALSTTYYKTVQAAIDAIGSGDVWNIVIVGEQTVPAGYYLVDNHLLKAPNVSVGFNGDCWTTSSVLSDGSTGRTKANTIDSGDQATGTDAAASFEAVRYSTTDKALKISSSIRPVYEDADNGYFNGVVKKDASWTVSIVTKPKAVTSNGTSKKIAIWGMGGPTWNSGKGMALLIGTDGKPELISYNGTTPTTLISTPQDSSLVSLYDDAFHTITISYDHSAITDRWTMYVDGARVVGSGSAAALSAMGAMFEVGSIYGGAAEISGVAIAENTLVDDVAAWNRALNASEVAAVASLYPLWPKFATVTISDETLAVDASTLVDSGSANKLTINVGDNSTAEELEITVPSDLHLALLKIVGTRPVKLIASDDFVGIATLTITAATKIRYESESMVAFNSGLQRGARTYEFKNASIGNYNDGTYKIHVCDGDSVSMLGNGTPKRNGESIEVEEGGTLTFNTSGATGYWYGTGATTFLQKGGTVNVPLSGTNLSGNNDGLLLGYTSTGVTSALVQGGTFDASTTILKLFICPSFNISGGTVKVKGVSRGDSTNNNNLVLSGGTLELGSAGWQNVTFNLNGGTFKAVASSNMASPIIIGGQATIEVGEGQTLTISGAISGSANITKTGAGRLVISGSLEDYTGTITASDGVIAASDFSKISTADTGRRLLVESIAEYASGHFTVPAELESVDFEVLRPTGVIATKAEVLADTEAKISGIVTSFDVTYTNTLRQAYSNVSGFSSNSDGNNTCTYNITPYDADRATEIGAYLKHQPHLKGLDANNGFYASTDVLTFAIVGTMPTTENTIFAHFGHSDSDRYGLLLITGTKKDDVLVAYNHGSTVTPITTMSVPNASTARHVYIVTKEDDRVNDTTTFTVYLDGQKWKTLEIDHRFMIVGNVQLGGDFWGRIRHDNIPENPYEICKEGTGGIVNCVRGYNRIISAAEIAKYSEVYHYSSPNGASERTFEATADWFDTTEGSTVWTNTPAEGEATQSGTPLAGAAIVANLTEDTTITVNVPADGLAYESFNIKGTGSVTFEKGEDSGSIRSTGMVTIGRPVTVKPGSFDLSTPPITLLEDGVLTFDYSDFDANNYDEETKIRLTGQIEASNTKVACLLPSVNAFHTAAFAYDSSINQYVLTIGLVPVDPENPSVVEPENIPETWTDVPQVEGQGGRYFIENEEGKLEIRAGAPANGLDSFTSYVLGLNPERATSKPYLTGADTASATTLKLVPAGVTVKDGYTATPKLRVGTTPTTFEDDSTALSDGGFTITLPTEENEKVKYYQIEYTITK